MTDSLTPSTTGGPGAREGDDPAQRGGLVIANRAVEHIARLAAGEVEVGDSALVKDAECVQALGRDIDAPLIRGSSVEVDALGANELLERCIQFGVELCHPRIPFDRLDGLFGCATIAWS